MLRETPTTENWPRRWANQGSAGTGLCRAVEVIQSGVIGRGGPNCVVERPIWPQGLARPAGSDPVPANLDWDLWSGPRSSVLTRRTPVAVRLARG